MIAGRPRRSPDLLGDEHVEIREELLSLYQSWTSASGEGGGFTAQGVLLTMFRKTRQHDQRQIDRAVRAQLACERDHRGPAGQVYERQA